jgi:hypothetical protein
MNNLIENIVIDKDRVTIQANKSITEKYLNEDFFVEYESEDIVNQDEQVIIAPFLLNIAPIVWLSGQVLKLSKCNKELYEGICTAQQLMKDQYPLFSWDGRIEVDELTEFTKQPDETAGTGVLFSGGLDSITSSLRHKSEKQLLIVMQGADIALDNLDGWEEVKKNNIES